MHTGPDVQAAVSRRAFGSVKASEAAVGMWYFLQRAFRNFLEPSSRAAAALGPNTLQGKGARSRDDGLSVCYILPNCPRPPTPDIFPADADTCTGIRAHRVI